MAKTDGRKRASGAHQFETPYLSAGERRAKEKALRDTVPRVSHAGWKAVKGRCDSVELLSQSNVAHI